MAETKETTDINEIKRWVEERHGKPCKVKGTGNENDIGIIRISFPGYSGKAELEDISWEDFEKGFNDANLKLLYQEKTASGEPSNFNRFIKR